MRFLLSCLAFCSAELLRSVLKDLDFRQAVRVSKEQQAQLVAVLTKDAEFLRDHNIMDYSLLLGIHYCTERRDPGAHCGGLTERKQRAGAAADKSQRVGRDFQAAVIVGWVHIFLQIVC